MFDIGWSEMAVILLVALIVIGPRDLPRVARTMGKWAGKGRAMAREFQTALEDMAREAELDKVKSEIEKAGRTIEKAGRTDVARSIEKTIDPSGELSKPFDPTASSDKGVGKPNGGAAASPAKPAAAPSPAAAPPSAAAPAAAPSSASAAASPAPSAGAPEPAAAPPKPPAAEPVAAKPARARSPRPRSAPAGSSPDGEQPQAKPALRKERARPTAPAESS
jgi:sec-independent protein translocase protein TatB